MLDYLINRAAVRSRVLRLPPVRACRRRASAIRRLRFHPDTPLAPDGAALRAGVEARGGHAMPVAHALPGDGTAVVDRLIEAGPAGWDWQGGDLLETDAICAQQRDVFLLGLDPGWLDLAQHYPGEPCFYMGCSLKREAVDAFRGGTRHWHLDIEDDRMLRLIIYLNAVGEGGGTFQYVDAACSAEARAWSGYRSGYLPDEAMRTVVDPGRWNSVTGAAGTIVAFDGTRVFHRVAAPTTSARFSLSLTYTSRHPLYVFRQVRLRTATRRAALPILANRERACLRAARWF